MHEILNRENKTNKENKIVFRELNERFNIPAHIYKHLRVAVVPLFDEDEEKRVERSVLRRDILPDVVYDGLKALRRDPDVDASNATDVVPRRLDEVRHQSFVSFAGSR